MFTSHVASLMFGVYVRNGAKNYYFFIRTPSRTDATLINFVPMIKFKLGIEWNVTQCLLKAQTLVYEDATIRYG